MPKGEARFNSAGMQVVRFESKPIPEGDYGLTLLDDSLGVKKSEEQGPDAVPYITARFTADNTAAKEGQKDRMVFKNFFLGLNPGSDGVVMPARAGGIIEFYRAHGTDLDVGVLELTKSNGDVVRYLDPEPILEQMKEWVDTSTPAHVSIERDKDRQTGKRDYNSPGRNVIAFWKVETEEQSAPAPKATGTAGKTNVTNLPKRKAK